MLNPALLIALVLSVIGLLLLRHDSRPFGTAFSALALYDCAGGSIFPRWSPSSPVYAAVVRGLGYTHVHLQNWGFISLSLLQNIDF